MENRLKIRNRIVLGGMTDLVNEIYRRGIIKQGSFKLKSGMTSPFYVDCKSIVQHPQLLNMAIDRIQSENDLKDIDWICGVPDGAVPFAAVLSAKTGVPLLAVRKRAKEYGITEQIPQGTVKGDKVFVIEDVVTTGGSLESFCRLLEEHGLDVAKKICIVNRGENTKVPPVVPLSFRHGTPIPANPLLHRLDRSVVWAADCGSMEGMLEKLEEYGPRIGILKTHMDTFSDFDERRLDRLIEMKQRFNILIWEDRKFADIGSVMDRQIKCDAYRYDRWVDIFSLHAITGRESLEYVFKNNTSYKWIIIGQLSSRGNLIDAAYTEAAKAIYVSNENVVGIVCQDDLGPEFVHIVPGISVERKGDHMGQSYSRPDDKSHADFLVVGRSIDSFLGSMD